MRRIGFSTGALARGDFRTALTLLRKHDIKVVELSALRLEELAPLVAAIPSLQLTDFSFVSIHAPSQFAPDREQWVVEQLSQLTQWGYPVIVHPDVIQEPARWDVLGSSLVIENMDKRKRLGRTVHELSYVFERLPSARFCFDIGHARQVDPSMTEGSLLLKAFRNRLVEVHMSEVNTASRHDPISLNAVRAFGALAAAIPEEVPIILESLIDQGQSDVESELQRARDVFALKAKLARVSGPFPAHDAVPTGQ